MPKPDLVAGEPFGKYVLVKRLAMGGMAEVSLAQLKGPSGFSKQVVIKQVLPAFAEHPQFIEMFLDEGRLAARLSHPNIAQTFELGEENGRYYLAMEFVPGESLYLILKRCRDQALRLPLPCVLRVAMQLLEALDYAHGLHDESGASLRLVHRDVTPSNVMVTHQGAIKLLDFGIARAATQLHKTEVGRVKGKGGYMAPEQCRSSRVDHRADVYGAGAVLYLMATGMKPFEHLPPGTDLLGQMNATMEGSFLKPHEVNRDIHPELERIILRAMALKPDDRYQSAGDMLDELEHFAAKANAFPSGRELGEFVKKLFPPRAEPEVDPSREVSSSRATPGPRRDPELATVDRPQPVDPPATVLQRAPPKRGVPRLVMLGGAGVVLLLLGVALALGLFAPRTKVAAPEPVVAVALPPPPAPPAEVVAKVQPPQVEAEPAVDETAPAAPTEREQTPAHPVSRKKKSRESSPRVQPTGLLQINAYPWAKVSLGGKELGVTPLNVRLPVGEHELVLENPAVNVKKTVKLTVTEEGQTSHFERME